jgi:hypothetical protein
MWLETTMSVPVWSKVWDMLQRRKLESDGDGQRIENIARRKGSFPIVHGDTKEGQSMDKK